jgi:hypothetical protein
MNPAGHAESQRGQPVHCTRRSERFVAGDHQADLDHRPSPHPFAAGRNFSQNMWKKVDTGNCTRSNPPGHLKRGRRANVGVAKRPNRVAPILHPSSTTPKPFKIALAGRRAWCRGDGAFDGIRQRGQGTGQPELHSGSDSASSSPPSSGQPGSEAPNSHGPPDHRRRQREGYALESRRLGVAASRCLRSVNSPPGKADSFGVTNTSGR